MKELNDRLLEQLEQLIAFLRFYNEMGWADYFEGPLERCRRFETGGLTRILGAYGGMDSLNDVVICQANGHRIEKNEENEANAHFWQLISEVNGLARRLLEDANKPG